MRIDSPAALAEYAAALKARKHAPVKLLVSMGTCGIAAGTGELAQRVVAEAANPQGDVFWGGGADTLAGYVDYLVEFGIVSGRAENVFAPNEPITRAEFTVMAVRFFDAYGDGDAVLMEQYTEFTDIAPGYWAAEYIRDAALYGWVRGYGDETFRPTASITRAEVVTLMGRLLGREADKEYIDSNLRWLNTFSDMTVNHWAYYAVMEAANSHIADMSSVENWSE